MLNANIININYDLFIKDIKKFNDHLINMYLPNEKQALHYFNIKNTDIFEIQFPDCK
jgi:hypothetical protein